MTPLVGVSFKFMREGMAFGIALRYRRPALVIGFGPFVLIVSRHGEFY